MDVVNLSNQLTNRPDRIIKILERLGCEKITFNKFKGYITSTRPDEDADNPLGNMVYIDNLFVHQNTRAYSGNIYTLVMDTKHVSFPESLELISKWAGIKNVPSEKIIPPFGGFFKKISKQEKYPETCLNKYNENILPDKACSYKFLKDGVSCNVQDEFNIRFSLEDNAIVIPIYDYQGNLCGAKARNNDSNCEESRRFWAFLEYQKSLTLYGYIQNYKNIIKKKTVIIVEAEKSVLQAASMDCRICIAVGGKNISETQARYIKSLGANKIIIAFDEGVCEEELQFCAKKLQVENKIFKNKVGYVFDDDNTYLNKGSKDSPLDVGKKSFESLIKRKVRWI